MNRFFRIFFINILILLGLFCIGCCSNLGSSININVIPVYTYQVLNTYPHDQSAFTEGLVFEDGVLYEGTGLYECSNLRRVELETGKVLQIRELSSQYFGEGITIYKNKIIQLTWKSNLGFVYDKYNFKLLQEFNYPNEGWGITYDGNCLIMSDGTSTLHFLDPETFEEISQIEVHENDIPVTKINELEYAQGEIFANIWLTERIARINPLTGQVTGWIDLKGILSPEDCSEKVDVLNGIAYNAKNNRLLVTGKFWPKLFEIELIKEEMGSNLIEDNPYIKILSPQAHEVWTEGDIREIRWNSFNINKVRIALAIGGHDKGHLGDGRNDFIIDAKQEKYTWKIPPGFVTDFGITRSDDVQISFFDASNDQALERCNFTIQGTNSKN